MQRRLGHELMDDPQADRRQLAGALRFIRWINAAMGGQRAMLSHLKAWSAGSTNKAGWPRVGEGVVTLLDVGTGSADLPIAARTWALGAGFDLRITGVDLHDTTLELAREHVARQRPEVRVGITLRKADALSLDESFAPHSFDYTHAGMFLHHLTEQQIIVVLRSMDRLASRGVIWNDLHRSRMGYLCTWLATVPCNRMVRHDARASVLAGFDQRDAERLAVAAGLSYTKYRLDYLTHRFTVAGEKT